MNVTKLVKSVPLRLYARGTAIRGRCLGALARIDTSRSASTCLSRRPLAIPDWRQAKGSIIFRRHYAIEEEVVKEVTSVEDVEDIETSLQNMISSGSNIAERIKRQNDDIKVGSELMVHALYDSLVDVALQLIIKTYPGGLGGLVESASDAYAHFPPGMELWIDQVRDALITHDLSDIHQSSLEEAVERTTSLFELVETAHSGFGDLFNGHHETINETVHKMHSILKRATKSDTYIDISMETKNIGVTSDQSTMDSEQTELDTLKTEINKLTEETRKWRNERSDLEQPRNFGEGVAWGFFGIGAAVAVGKRSKLSGSISSNESKLQHERALQSDHQTRYNDAFARVEKANLELIALRGHKATINEYITSLKNVLASSEQALTFVAERKNTLTRIRTDLTNMMHYATSYSAHGYDEEASARFLAEGMVDVFDATPDWPGTTTPLMLAVILLRWPPSLIAPYDDILGDGKAGADFQEKFNRVVEKASREYMRFAEATRPLPRLDHYLRDIEFYWEKTFYHWHKLIDEAHDTSGGFRPAPVVAQWQ